ncbi:MAG: 16S rRNA (cytidine(1402)-2'-O)-methyltransferase, partial [Anaerolineae bacterium]|nr:16S rRNA (cytidine(1402)-2'-O)-methyltransferase [Anaerolineae bacterium]
DTLALIAEVMGAERRVCVARELSKKFEQFYRGNAQELRDHFAADNPRGEVTLVISGADPEDAQWTEEQVRSALNQRLAAGEALSRAARAVAKSAGWPKNKVYQLGIKDG